MVKKSLNSSDINFSFINATLLIYILRIASSVLSTNGNYDGRCRVKQCGSDGEAVVGARSINDSQTVVKQL